MIIIPLALLEKEDIELTGTLKPAEMDIQDTALIQFTTDITYNLQAKMINGGILLNGTVASKIHCCCGRCMQPIDQDIINREVCHFYEDINEQELDVTDDIREDLLIEMPMNPLCSEACRGLCSQCGVNLNEESCDCVAEAIEDDIWGDLDKLNFND